MLFNLLKTAWNGKAGIRTLHLTNTCNKTHYEVLKVPQNCTNREIKQAFVKLSKQYHPDSNTAKSSQNEFVKVVNAYKVLSKKDTRRAYDLGLPLSKIETRKAEQKNDEYPTARDPWDDPSFYKNRDQSRDSFYSSKPYYGINGVKKLSNGSIVGICVLAAAVAVFIQILAIRYSLTLKREELIKRSDECEAVLADLRRVAEVNGNELQIEIMKEKMRRDKYTNYSDD